MFIIYLPALVNLLDETYKMEKTLNTEMENQLQTAVKMKESWFGESAETFQYVMNKEMQTGSYQSAYSYVKGLRELLEYFYPTVKQPISCCEQIGEQLKQDVYTEPMLGVPDEVSLTFNYDYISSLNGDCVMAMNSAEKAKKVLQRMMEESARWINWSREEDELYYAWKKMQRLEHYREEFNTLAHRLSTLEYEMTSEMDRIIARNDEFLMPDTNLATKDMEQRKHDMTTFDEIKEVESIYDMDKVITIMNNEAETWTVEDCEYIAGAFEQYLQRKDYVGMNAVVSRLMIYNCNPRMNNSMLMPMNDFIYTTRPDLNKIEKITGQINKMRHVTVYQTLGNLSKVEEMKISYDKDDTLGLYVEPMQEDEEQKFFIVHLFAGNSYHINEQNYNPQTFYKTGDDMQSKSVKVYVQGIEDVLPAKTMESIEKLGYTYEEVAAMLEGHQLTLSYKDYEILSDDDKNRYNEEAKRLLFTMLSSDEIQPDEILQYEYSIPIGYDMTMTYSASTKGTIPGDVVNSTLEYQRTELQSISLNQGNTDVSLGKDSLGAGRKVDVGEGLQVGSALDFDFKSLEATVSVSNEKIEKGLKYQPNLNNGTTSVTYFVETHISEEASIYSEVEIAKEDNGSNDAKDWEYVQLPIIERLPESI